MKPRPASAISLFAALLLVMPAFQVHAASNPVLDKVTQAANQAKGEAEKLVPWDQLPWHSQQEILDAVKGELDAVDRAVAGQLSNLTGIPMQSLVDLVPMLHDELVSILEEANRTQSEVVQAINQVVGQIPVPVLDPGPPPTTSMAFVAYCQLGGFEAAYPQGWDQLCFALLVVAATIARFVNHHRILCLDLDEEDMQDECTKEWEQKAGQAILMADDLDQDGLKNLGEFRWDLVPVCIPLHQNCVDFEKNATRGDGGDHWWDGPEVHYWNNPANDPYLSLELDSGFNGTTDATAASANETLRDLAPAPVDGDNQARVGGSGGGGAGGGAGSGGGGGGDPCTSNCDPDPCSSGCDPCSSGCEPGCTLDCPPPDPSDPPDPNDLHRKVRALLQDPDRFVDSDGDGLPNSRDPDSDNDGLLDGDEHGDADHGYSGWDTYPEFADSDCALAATVCTPSSQTTFFDATREGSPGTGDQLNDTQELAYWLGLGGNSWRTDHDGDGIANSLLDPDSDNDGLLDGQEITLGRGQVRPDRTDTDSDGVRDSDEVAWNADSDGDNRVNANDPDSDNDGLPDKWEMDHHFNMADPTDADLDRDGDALTNLGEYQHTTDPDDMDTEGDLLLDGEEVNTHHTNPLHWDTDGDAMPDRYEVQHALAPTNAADASQDADVDSFLDVAWTNLREYQFNRPPGYDEAASGPWFGGTLPRDPDTDKDAATDGYEVKQGTNPALPGVGSGDPDSDGLSHTQELAANTDPTNPDTDGDGLCDGGRAVACTLPGGAIGGQPGEADYGSNPRSTDTDSDGIPDGQEAARWDPQASGVDSDLDGDGAGGVTDPDSDGDQLLDGAELHQYRTEPGVADTDADRLGDGEEVLLHGTDPLEADTDLDRLTDGQEVLDHGTNPVMKDTDADLLRDGDEILIHRTNATNPDTEGDGMPDGWEVRYKLDPLNDDSGADADEDGPRTAGYKLTTDPANATQDAAAALEAVAASFTNLQEYEAGTHPRVADTDEDTLPDGWEVLFGLDPTTPLDRTLDFDQDGLTNLDEFQWRLIPACVGVIRNCWDHERDMLGGAGGDLWRDGDEVQYWNDPSNDNENLTLDHASVDAAFQNATTAAAGMPGSFEGARDTAASQVPDANASATIQGAEYPAEAQQAQADAADQAGTEYQDVPWTVPGTHMLFDPDAQLDSDGDGKRNVDDLDSDNDRLLDGPEIQLFGTYPELPDSDCAVAAINCTSSRSVANRLSPREGNPGTGDGIADGAELLAWDALSPGSVLTDFDGDGPRFNGLTSNLLDPDSDNDGLLDGQEFTVHGTHPGKVDTDNDNLTDFEEVNTWHTDPADWDTDGDGLPDGWEVKYNFNPLAPSDGELDGDQDSYNPDGATIPAEAWSNLKEYQYGIPGNWDIALDGVWWWGTKPDVADTDGDGTLDGVEVHFGTDPTNGASHDPRGDFANRDGLADALSNNTANDDLPDLDPTNRAYLESQAVRASYVLEQTLQGNTSAAIDYAADLTEDTTTYVWNQEALDPVRPTLERIPFVQTVRDAPNLIRSLKAPVANVTDFVQRGVGILVPAVVETVETGSPDPLLGAVNQVGPYIASAPYVGQLLPKPARNQLNNLTVPTPEQIIGEVQDLQESPMTPVSELQALVRSLLPTTTPMPTFTADVTNLLSLPEIYEALNTVHQNAEETPHGATVADVPFYDVLVQGPNGISIEPNLQVGVPTALHIDDLESTGDPSGFDVTVTLTLNAPENPTRPGLPILPGLRITKIDPTQHYEASLHAFLQVPAEESAILLGIDQRANVLNTGNATHADLPSDVWVRLTDYKPAVTVSVLPSDLQETRFGIGVESNAPAQRPLLFQAGLVPYDVEDHDKTPLPNEDHSITALLSAIPAKAGLHAESGKTTQQGRLLLDWSASQVLDLALVFVDQSNGHGIRQDVNLTGLPTTAHLAVVDVLETKQVHIDYTATSVMDGVHVYHRNAVTGGERDRIYVKLEEVPRKIDLNLLPGQDRYEYTSDTPLGSAIVNLSPSGEECHGATTVHYVVHTPGGCTTVAITGLQSFLVDTSTGNTLANWQRQADEGGLTVNLQKDPLKATDAWFLLQSSTWPARGEFQLTQQAGGAKAFTWNATAAIASVHASGDTRATGNGARYSFNVTDLPQHLAGDLNTARRVFNFDAVASLTSIDFAYTTRLDDKTLTLQSDYLTIDQRGNQSSLHGSIHGIRNVHVDLASGQILHIDGEIATPNPMRIVYRGNDGSVDAYLSNVPTQVQLDYNHEVTSGQHVRHLTYTATSAIGKANVTGSLHGTYFKFRFLDLPTSLTVDVDPVNQHWETQASAPVGLIHVEYVENDDTFPAAPSSGDWAIFYDEPQHKAGVSNKTVAYGARLTGFKSALLDVDEAGFHLVSTRLAPQPFTVYYGVGIDYVNITVLDLPANLGVTYQSGSLHYAASEAMSRIDVDAYLVGDADLKSKFQILARAQNVPAHVDATWPAVLGGRLDVQLVHDGATPMGPLSLQWWDLTDSDALLSVPYLKVGAASVPDHVRLTYDDVLRRLQFTGTQAGVPAMLAAPVLTSVPSGISSIQVPNAQEYLVVQQQKDGKGPVLLNLSGIKTVDALLSPLSGQRGYLHAEKAAAGRFHARFFDEAQGTTSTFDAGSTPASMRLAFILNQTTDGVGNTTFQGLDASWTASDAITNLTVRLESIDAHAAINRLTLSTPSLPMEVKAHYVSQKQMWLTSNTPFTLNATYGNRDRATYPAASNPASDYVMLEPDRFGEAFSARIEGLRAVRVDMDRRHALLQRESARDLEIRATRPQLTIGIVLDDPPTSLEAWWQQNDGRDLDYRANGPMGGLKLSLDRIQEGTNLPVFVHVTAQNVAPAVLVQHAPGTFSVTTPSGGSIGDVRVELSLDGTRQVPLLGATEGVVLQEDRNGALQQLTGRIVGLQRLEAKTVATKTEVTLERSNHIPGGSFRVHTSQPDRTVAAVGTTLPKDAHLVFDRASSLLLQWTATHEAEDVQVRISNGPGTAVHTSLLLSNLPAEVELQWNPTNQGATLNYWASATISSISAALNLGGKQLAMNAQSLTGNVQATLTNGYLDGFVANPGQPSGRIELDLYESHLQPLRALNVLDNYVHLDVSSGSGFRVHALLTGMQDLTWKVNRQNEVYDVTLNRDSSTAGLGFQTFVQLDSMSLHANAVEMPASFTMHLDMDTALIEAEGQQAGSLLDFKWTANGVLGKLDLRTTPTLNGHPVTLNVVALPANLVFKVEALAGGSLQIGQSAGSRPAALTLDATKGGNHVWVEALDLPSHFNLLLGPKMKRGELLAQSGAGFGSIRTQVHPSSQGLPALDSPSFVLVEATVPEQPVVNLALTGGVGIQRVLWNVEPGQSKMILERDTLASGPAFSFKVSDAEKDIHGKASSLPTKVQYDSPVEGTYVVSLGGVAQGELHYKDTTNVSNPTTFDIVGTDIPANVDMTFKSSQDVVEGVLVSTARTGRLVFDAQDNKTVMHGELEGIPPLASWKSETKRSPGKEQVVGYVGTGALQRLKVHAHPQGEGGIFPVQRDILDIHKLPSGKTQFFVDLRDLSGATWDLTIPDDPKDKGFIVDASLQRSSAGRNLRVVYEDPTGGRNNAQLVADVEVTAGPAQTHLVVKPGLYLYEAPGSTQHFDVFVDGLDVPGLGGRGMNTLRLMLNGVTNGIGFEDGCNGFVIDGGGNPGGIQSGTLDILLGDRPATEPSSCASNNLQLDVELDIDQFYLRANTGSGPAFQSGIQNQLLMQETTSSYAVAARLAGLQLLEFEMEKGAGCDDETFSIKTAQLDLNTPGSNLFISMDSKIVDPCNPIKPGVPGFEFYDSRPATNYKQERWMVRVNGMPTSVRLHDLEYVSSSDIRWSIAVDGPLAYVRLWNDAGNTNVEITDLPTGNSDFRIYKTGLTNKIVIVSPSPIGRFNAGLASEGGTEWYNRFDLRGPCRMTMEGDFDGAQKYGKAFFFISDDCVLSGAISRIGTKLGVEWAFKELSPHGFQIFSPTELMKKASNATARMRTGWNGAVTEGSPGAAASSVLRLMSDGNWYEATEVFRKFVAGE